MDNLAWNSIPDIRTLYNIIDKRVQPLNLIICLPDYKIPDFQTAQDASDGECRLKHRLEQALQCLQFNSINLIEHILPDVRFWLVPPSRTNRLHEHFQHISWQSEAAAQAENTPDKPWFAHPYTSERQKPEHILVIGAGISGAATAYILAEYGISVTVLDAGKAASAASGNRQGLLYAKISPHDTEQTELLLTGYGYTKTPAQTHPARLRHMGRKRHHPPQLQPRRIPSQSRIGVTKTPCTPLPQHHVCRSRKNRRYPPQRPLHRTIMRPFLAARRMAQSARIRPRPPQPSAD